jgi:hypothetical protein
VDVADMIMSKIEENQRNQVEQIYIVDNINEVEAEGLGSSPMRGHGAGALDHRVTTVEEQQTQEDMEDEDEQAA